MKTAVQHEGGAQARIIAAARTLFATRGFHQTAMADLAQEAQVSVGAIYRSFDGKAAIIRAIIVLDTHEMLAEIHGLLDRVRDGQLAIDAAIDQIILHQLCRGDEALAHDILAEGHRNPDVAEAIADFLVQYRAAFRELARFANARLSEQDLDAAGELLLAYMFGLAHRRLSRPGLDEQAAAKLATCFILRALGAEIPAGTC
jgi:TetR/AcrR family transcriptional repressor of uid operon